jgi:hypothetical protein
MTRLDFSHGHVEDSMTVAPQFENGDGPEHIALRAEIPTTILDSLSQPNVSQSERLLTLTSLKHRMSLDRKGNLMSRASLTHALLHFSLILLVATSHLSANEPQIERAMSATFRIVIGESSGTSFLIEAHPQDRPADATRPEPNEPKPNDAAKSNDDAKPVASRQVVLVTCAHLFRDTKVDKAKLILRTKRDDFDYQRVELMFPIRTAGKKLWVEHPDHDIAAIRVQLPRDVDAAPFRFEQLAAEPDVIAKRVHVAQETWTPCFPVQIEGHPAGWPILRRGTIATHPLAPVNTMSKFRIDVSSFGGDSGAPVVVFPNDQRTGIPLVAGMCIGTALQTDKTTSFYEERTMHTPLGMAIAVQAAHIRDAIERLEPLTE